MVMSKILSLLYSFILWVVSKNHKQIRSLNFSLLFRSIECIFLEIIVVENFLFSYFFLAEIILLLKFNIHF